MIIDAHVHLDSSSEFALAESAAKLIEAMDNAEIAAAIAMPLSGPDYNPRAESERLINLSLKNPRIYPIAAFDLDYIKESQDAIGEYIAKGLIVGVKFFTGYQAIDTMSEHIAPILHIAQQHAMPVVFHTGGVATGQKTQLRYCADHFKFDDLANMHENLKINCAHFNAPNFIDMALVMESKASVHADLSGLFYGEYDKKSNPYLAQLEGKLYHAITYLGEVDRLMFGSDNPICDMKSHKEFMERLFQQHEFEQSDIDKIMFRNATSFYKLDTYDKKRAGKE